SLSASMETYLRVRGRKRLLLARNQEQTTRPHRAQDVELIRAAAEGADAGLPELGTPRWLPGTDLVELDVEAAAGVRVSVVYSCGDAGSFGRRWREAPAEPRDGSFVARIPVVDPAREIRL